MLHMLQRFINYLGVLLLGCIALPGQASTPLSASEWGQWLQQQISLHPQLSAAQQTMAAEFATAEELTRPLYNPELETEFEREGEEDNYRIGLQQVIDWSDKRNVRRQQAHFRRIEAEQRLILTRQQYTADTLEALSTWQAASQSAALAERQEQQLQTLINLVHERRRTGDLGQLDSELAIFGLSQKLNQTARAQARVKQAEAELHERLPGWSAQARTATIPAPFWKTVDSPVSAQQLEQHPLVYSSWAAWQRARQSAELAQRASRADPKVGISAGRSGPDNLVALNLSIPLNLRNNHSARARAAAQRELVGEAEYRAVRRQQQMRIKAAAAVVQAYRLRFEQWRALVGERSEQSRHLIDKRWRSGDLGTSDYLLALQQLTDGLNAGIELRERFEHAQIDWLLAAGQIEQALTRLPE